MISQFQSFRELLLHCLDRHNSGDSQHALALIDEYLGDPRASRPAESFWCEYNVQQALGFRVTFTEKLDALAALDSEEKHLDYCTHQVRYWLSAAADSSARVALARFRRSEIEAGRKVATEAVRFAGVLGLVSATVAAAAEEARKHWNS
jgi:hypothetical protein